MLFELCVLLDTFQEISFQPHRNRREESLLNDMKL
jgi:hypothetical protein